MRSISKALLFTLVALFMFRGQAQTVNPQTDIRWNIASGCTNPVNVYSPAAQGCIATGGTAYGFSTYLAATMTSSQTTMSVGTTAGYPTQGVVMMDTEWMQYTGISGSTLTGLTRGYHQTTAAAHNAGGPVLSVGLSFTPVNQVPLGGVFGLYGGGTAQILAANCGFPVVFNDSGYSQAFQANCGSAATWIDQAGRIHQANVGGSYLNWFLPFYVGPTYADAGGLNFQPVPVTNSTLIAQTNAAYNFTRPISFQQGIAGTVQSTTVPNIPAPATSGSQGGSCTVTYEVVGTDADGEAVGGTPVVQPGMLFPSAGIVYFQVPLVAGVVTYNIYRTAVSGCGSLAIGKFTSAATSAYPIFQDTGNTGDGTSPPAASTVAKTCTNGEQFCTLSGTGSTPPVSCAAGTAGWEYHNTAATASPHVYICQSGTWATAY